MNCLNCNNKPAIIKFCSKSCAASYNNRLFPKRTATVMCELCRKKIRNVRRSNLCRNCKADYNLVQYGEHTLKSVIHIGHARHRYQSVRNHAHKIAKRLNIPKECDSCGYIKHLELAHIRGIADFPLETLLKEINCVDNLIYLCRLHHGELDAKH